MAYALELPTTSRGLNVFHVSRLKKVLGQHQTTQLMLPLLDEDRKLIFEPKYIIGTREKILRTLVIKEYIINWKNIPE